MDLQRTASLDAETVQFLAAQLVAEFGHLYPTWDLAPAINELREDNGAGIPIHVAAIENGPAIGIASIIPDDEVTGWEGKEAWLANVLVLPEFRNRGIGGRLVEGVIEIARESEVRDLHLVTDTEEGWYLGKGWEIVGVGHVHGNQMTVMHLCLGGH
jgi:GNAT superfamily N-acetyltransferase